MNKLIKEKLKEVKKYGKKTIGQKFLIEHLEGKRITRDQAIKAKCYECIGYAVDGAKDCGITSCPLYPFSPFKGRNK